MPRVVLRVCDGQLLGLLWCGGLLEVERGVCWSMAVGWRDGRGAAIRVLEDACVVSQPLVFHRFPGMKSIRCLEQRELSLPLGRGTCDAGGVCVGVGLAALSILCCVSRLSVLD